MKNKYKWITAGFMAFFLYEYTLPIINGLELGASWGWTWQETLVHRQVIKHVLRLPIYGLIYAWIFVSIPKKSKIALWVWRVMAWSHLIFKPLTTWFLLYIAGKAGMWARFPIISLSFPIIVITVYGMAIFVVERYWKKGLAKSNQKR